MASLRRTWFCAGAGTLFAAYLVHDIFCKISLKAGLVRGQLRALAPGKFAKLSYGETHYLIHGKDGSDALTEGRPLIVLVHGFGGSSAVWENSQYLKALHDANLDVLAFDNWGHGFSQGPDIGYSIELFVTQLCELLVFLDIGKSFHLLGFSMGGSIATLFAHRYQHRVQSLILQAPAIARLTFLNRLPLLLFSKIPFLSELAALLILPHFGEGANNDNDAVARAGYRLLQQMASGSWMRDGHVEDMLREIVERDRTKVLILWGNRDSAVPFKGSKRIREIAPDASFVEAEGADHMTFAERGSELGERVGALFRTTLVDFLLGREVGPHDLCALGE